MGAVEGPMGAETAGALTAGAAGGAEAGAAAAEGGAGGGAAITTGAAGAGAAKAARGRGGGTDDKVAPVWNMGCSAQAVRTKAAASAASDETCEDIVYDYSNSAQPAAAMQGRGRR